MWCWGGNDLRPLGDAIHLGRRILSVVQQSIAIALILKATFVVLGVFGVISLAIAVFEDMGSSLLVTLNATRLFPSLAKKLEDKRFNVVYRDSTAV